MVLEQTSTRDTEDTKGREFFHRFYSYFVFSFTTQMAIATFAPSPCQETSFCSKVPLKCFGVPWEAHKRLSYFWRKGHISDASSSHFSTLLCLSMDISHIVRSTHELLALLQHECSGVCYRTTKRQKSWWVI